MKFVLTIAALAAVAMFCRADCTGKAATYGGCSGSHASYATPVRSFLHHFAANHASGCSGAHATYVAVKVSVVAQAAPKAAKPVPMPAAAPAPVAFAAPAPNCPSGVCPMPAARMPLANGPVRAVVRVVQTAKPPLARVVVGVHDRLIQAGQRAHCAAHNVVDLAAAGTHRLLHFLTHPAGGRFRKN
jgi:hypothetical protein